MNYFKRRKLIEHLRTDAPISKQFLQHVQTQFAPETPSSHKRAIGFVSIAFSAFTVLLVLPQLTPGNTSYFTNVAVAAAINNTLTFAEDGKFRYMKIVRGTEIAQVWKYNDNIRFDTTRDSIMYSSIADTICNITCSDHMNLVDKKSALSPGTLPIQNITAEKINTSHDNIKISWEPDESLKQPKVLVALGNSGYVNERYSDNPQIHLDEETTRMNTHIGNPATHLFQIMNNAGERSAVYEINLDTISVREITKDELLGFQKKYAEELKRDFLLTGMERFHKEYFREALELRNNLDVLGKPVHTIEEMLNGQPITRIQYAPPYQKNVLVEFTIYTETNLLAEYAEYENGEIVQQTRIEEFSIVSDVSPQEFFQKEYWEGDIKNF